MSVKIIFLSTVFILFIFFPAYYRKDSAVIIKKYSLDNFNKGNIFEPEMDQVLIDRYSQEKNLIEDNFKERNILVISSDDTYLLYLTGKSSLLKINPLTGIINQSDIEFALQKVYQLCPRKIVIDCNATGSCPFDWKLNYLIYPYKVLLDRINQQCHIQYKPQKCTSQLCIAAAD